MRFSGRNGAGSSEIRSGSERTPDINELKAFERRQAYYRAFTTASSQLPQLRPPWQARAVAGRTGRGRGPSAITTHHATTGRSQSAHTRRAYAAAGQPALPATPEAVTGHLASLACRLGPSGLRRRLASIANRHRRGGQPWDPAQPAIRVTLRRPGGPGAARRGAGRGRAPYLARQLRREPKGPHPAEAERTCNLEGP